MSDPGQVRKLFAGVSMASMLALTAGGCEPAPVAKPAPAPKVADAHDHDHDHDHDSKEGGHHHAHGEKGPHGGALVALGEEAAHVEIVLDAETGKLTAYVLDGAGKEAVAIKQPEIELTYSLIADDKDKKKSDDLEILQVKLAAVTPTAEGMASTFAGQADALKGQKEFKGVLPPLTINKAELKATEFQYPEGNEHHH